MYWKPIYNLFEGAFGQVLVVNAQHMKALPGRKTDVRDAEWIGDLLQHGSWRGQASSIKLSSVISDITGVSGRAMLEALAAGETNATTIAQLARRRMKKKQPELEKALTGSIQEHQRYIIAKLLKHIDFLDGLTEESSREIERRLTPLDEEIQRLCTIPGVGTKSCAQGAS